MRPSIARRSARRRSLAAAPPAPSTSPTPASSRTRRRTGGRSPSPTRTTSGSRLVDGSGVRPLTTHPGVESGPALLARRVARRLHEPLRGEHRRLRRARGRRRAEAADVPPRHRRRPRLHARRQVGPLLLAASGLHDAGTRSSSRCRSSGGFPTRLPIPNASKAAISPDGKTIAYVPLAEAFAPVEALPRRADRAHPALRRRDARRRAGARSRPAAATTRDPMWVGEPPVLPLRPRRRVQPLRVRPGDEGGRDAAHDSRRFPGALGERRRRPDRLRAGRLREPPRPGDAASSPRLKLGVAADLLELRPRWAKGAKWVRDASLSPSGAAGRPRVPRARS